MNECTALVCQSLQEKQTTTSFNKAVLISLLIDTFDVQRNHHTTTTTILWPFFRDHSGESVPEENFWTLWCNGRLTEVDTDHPAGHHSIRTNQCPPPPTLPFFTGRMPFLPPNQQCQSTKGKQLVMHWKFVKQTCITADRYDMSSKAMSCVWALNDSTQLWIPNTSFLPCCAHWPRTYSDFDDICSSKN